MTGKKIRVLHIAQAAGGVDRYLRMLLKYMDKEQFENIVVFSQSFDKKDYEGLVDGYQTVEMDRSIEINDIKSVFQIRKLIKEYEPDVVYVHSSKAGAVGRLANIGIKNICIYSPHGWAFNMRCSGKKQFLYACIEKMAAHFCDKIICISNAEKQSALDKKICKENKLQIIYNGIDIDDYENSIHGKIKRCDIGVPADAFVIGMVGRICKQKAPDIFIQAAEMIKKELPNAYFILVGDGDMTKSIKKYAEENDLSDSLYITGWVDNPMDYIEIFDVACLLSRWEGFGLVVPEYMLCRKPVIACNVDALPDIIENEQSGILVEVDNYVEVYENVMRLYANSEWKIRLINTAYKKVFDDFNARRVSFETDNLIKSMMGKLR